MSDCLKVSSALSLPLDAVTQSFVILGRRGSGKTSTAKVMAEEMMSAGQTIVWIDPLGVAWGLRSDYQILILGGEHADIPLEPTSGKLVAEFLVAERMSCILDVFGFSEGEMKRFVADFATAFYRLNTQAVHLFVDEADEFAPQSGSMRDAARSLGAMQNVVRRGRARGIGVTLITQRSAVLNKSVMTQAECLVAMQTTGPHDLAAINDWIKYHCETVDDAKTILKALPKLQTGTGFVYSPSWLKMLKVVQFRRLKSFDSSSTPKPGQEISQPKTLAQIDIPALKGQMAELIKSTKENDPKELRARIRELEKSASKPAETKPGKSDPRSIDAAVKKAVDERDKFWKSKLIECRAAIKTRDKALEKISEASKVDPYDFADVTLPEVVKTPVASGDRSANPPPVILAAKFETQKTSRAISEPYQRILDAISKWSAIGEPHPTLKQVGYVADYSSKSGTFNTYLSGMKSEGLIERVSGKVWMTEHGKSLATSFEADDGFSFILSLIGSAPLVAILRSLKDAGTQINVNYLGERTGYSGGSGTFNTYLSTLNSLGLITRKSGMVGLSAFVLDGGHW